MRYSGTSAGILAAFAIATSLTLGVPQPAQGQPSQSAETVRTAEASYPRLYQGWRAGVIVGTDVEGLLGEELGQVVDLVVGPDGRLESAVIEASGMLDVGEARFTVPWHQLMPGSVDGVLAYPVTGPDTLSPAPTRWI
ncbi:PRC-barrel domain-containing protein [Azospirillum brasilense]|uniref:PRC-barrel domain-containing protein n=1 Tax=Azospirillum brasilense TaxID=192 RepID=UPI001EDA33C3|nr:PRC-barrel domain-containing protein [Azospirillum brasilense]UKJ72803.1 PRC-barrel domain-containing protein [Azospirillum brasilense]